MAYVLKPPANESPKSASILFKATAYFPADIVNFQTAATAPTACRTWKGEHNNICTLATRNKRSN
jgi:hypothetical protein